MNKDLLQLIKVNRDAHYVNRGFYFQYLVVLHKWVNNFINGTESEIYTEVGNDIKEVGKKLIYTQVKCYTSSFSLTSPVLKKEIFTFFVQYLEDREMNPEIEFHFLTNTSLTRNENLLRNWQAAQPLVEGELKSQCCKKVKEILAAELKTLQIARLNTRNITEQQKKEIKSDFAAIMEMFDFKHSLPSFVGKLRWSFGEQIPEKGVADLHFEILQKLSHHKFEGKPTQILMEALLSEIYRCSQLTEKANRKVDNSLLNTILKIKDDELNQYVNIALISLLDVRLHDIYKQLNDLRNVQEEHGSILTTHIDAFKEVLSNSQNQTEEALPKDLTLVPALNSADVIGRDNDLKRLKKSFTENRCVSLSGSGGMGKSTLAKLFVNIYYEEYNHIIWLNSEMGLLKSIIINDTLASNLNLDLLTGNNGEKERLLTVINQLNKIGGKNLFIINDLIDGLEHLNELKTLRNWQILITSRLRISECVLFEVAQLPFKQAKLLYRKFEVNRLASDEHLAKFFELIQYNTLTIELVAKTIHLSFDLTLEGVLQHFQEQSLDDDDLAIDLVGHNENSRLLSILLKTFDLSGLEPIDLYYMEFIALLPSDDVSLSDIIIWYGKEYEKRNKTEITAGINRLHEKGMLMRDGDKIQMHKIFQESVLYQVRKRENSFVGQSHHIVWLTALLMEGAANNPTQAVRFLKYGESILKNIKEGFRSSVYQPLIILENEVLNILNWLKTSESTVIRWQDLAERARMKLKENDMHLGVIFNNYALALLEIMDLDKAKLYFEMSIKIFKKNEADALPQLLNTLCNLAQLHIRLHEIKVFKSLFDDMVKIRKRHKFWEDTSFPVQCHILGMANQTAENYPSAIQMYSIAINAHEELPDEKKNDLHLIMYLNNLAVSFFFNKEYQKAEKATVRAVNVLYSLGINTGKHFTGVIQTLILIADYNGNAEAVVQLTEIYKNSYSSIIN